MRNRRLSRAIADVGWSGLITKLHAKLKARGGYVVRVDRFFPSTQLCSHCEARNAALKLKDRTCVSDHVKPRLFGTKTRFYMIANGSCQSARVHVCSDASRRKREDRVRYYQYRPAAADHALNGRLDMRLDNGRRCSLRIVEQPIRRLRARPNCRRPR